MFCRTGAGGTETLKFALICVMSKMSEKVSLFRSAGHVLLPQWANGLVTTRASTAVLNPSQSGTLAGTGHGGRVWEAVGHARQLAATSGAPSASVSPVYQIRTEPDSLV